MPGPDGYNSYRRAVNNWGQENGKKITFVTTASGPQSRVVWSSMIYVDQIPGLTEPANASNRVDAEERAATVFWGHKDVYA